MCRCASEKKIRKKSFFRPLGRFPRFDFVWGNKELTWRWNKECIFYSANVYIQHYFYYESFCSCLIIFPLFTSNWARRLKECLHSAWLLLLKLCVYNKRVWTEDLIIVIKFVERPTIEYSDGMTVCLLVCMLVRLSLLFYLAVYIFNSSLLRVKALLHRGLLLAQR